MSRLAPQQPKAMVPSHRGARSKPSDTKPLEVLLHPIGGYQVILTDRSLQALSPEEFGKAVTRILLDNGYSEVTRHYVPMPDDMVESPSEGFDFTLKAGAKVPEVKGTSGGYTVFFDDTGRTILLQDK